MSKTKILIVEDETVAAMDIKAVVESLGCEATGIVHTQNKVFDSIEKNKPDIILMDVKLNKDQDGIEIAKEVQKLNDIPILYITAYSDDDTMQRAFDTNPIGYIVKPFKPEDLKTSIQLARHKLNLEKPSKINEDHYYIGEGFYFDTFEKNLYYNGNFVKLGPKEKELLSILIDANYTKVQFSDLEEMIWDGNKPSNSALRTLMYRLKGKLGNNIIEVTYGYGYNLRKPN